MPANLTPQYHEAEDRFKLATTPADKVAALQEMLRLIPKHKGTEKMQADLKKRLAKLKKQSQSRGGKVAHRPFHHVEREGIGQVVVCGPPNSGKSALVDKLTHAQPEVADFPFTTRAPLPAMLHFEDVQIQLVDTPPLAPEVLESWQLAQIAQSDIALLVFDVNDPQLLDQTEFALAELADRKIRLDGSSLRPKTLVLGNKIDVAGGMDNFEAWKELYGERLAAVPFTTSQKEYLTRLSRRLFDMLEVVRVYTKRPNKPPEKDAAPFVLRHGSTVLDAAAAVHHDFAESFKYARIWGKNKFDGQMVERTYIVEDGDLLEIHA